MTDTLLSNPRDLITRQDVEIVLKKDKGPTAVLDSFVVQDFTKKGDNFAGIVTSVVVKYSTMNKSSEVTYVVKLNPQKIGQVSEMMELFFNREVGFYEQILPELNYELEKAGEPKLKMPKYFHSSLEAGSEVIYLEDLRQFGYRMLPRQESLGKEEVVMVVKELSRLHSSSYLLLNREEFRTNKVKSLITKYPFCKEVFDLTDDSNDLLEQFLTFPVTNAANLIEVIPGYENAVKYLRENINDFFMDIKNISKAEEHLTVLCHGDCWNNNFLFRYSPGGELIDCRLLDLQAYKLSSGTLDINHLLYTSVGGDCRKENLQTILDCYYSTFANVLSNNRATMPYSLPMFKEDFFAKNKFGLMMAIVLVPNVLLDQEDAPEIEEFLGDDEDLIKNHGLKLIKKLKDSPILKSRFLETFDEFRDYGLFESIRPAET